MIRTTDRSLITSIHAYHSPILTFDLCKIFKPKWIGAQGLQTHMISRFLCLLDMGCRIWKTVSQPFRYIPDLQMETLTMQTRYIYLCYVTLWNICSLRIIVFSYRQMRTTLKNVGKCTPFKLRFKKMIKTMYGIQGRLGDPAFMHLVRNLEWCSSSRDSSPLIIVLKYHCSEQSVKPSHWDQQCPWGHEHTLILGGTERQGLCLYTGSYKRVFTFSTVMEQFTLRWSLQ